MYTIIMIRRKSIQITIRMIIKNKLCNNDYNYDIYYIYKYNKDYYDSAAITTPTTTTRK